MELLIQNNLCWFVLGNTILSFVSVVLLFLLLKKNVNSSTDKMSKSEHDKNATNDNSERISQTKHISCICKCWKWIRKHLFEIVIVVSLVLNVIMVCMLCPRHISENNLGFDYMGVIVAALAALITLLIGWNIYSVIDMKNLKEETERQVDEMFQEKTEEYARTLKYDIDRNFITEEAVILDILFKQKQWNVALPFIRLSTKRYLRLFESGYKDMNIEMFSYVVAQMINETDADFINQPDFVGFMEIFKDLEQYESNVSSVYKAYKDKVANAPKEQTPLMGTVQQTTNN